MMEMLVTAGILSVSSSAIIAKMLIDSKRSTEGKTELILGIILFDDLFLALYLSIMSALLLGGGLSLLNISTTEH